MYHSRIAERQMAIGELLSIADEMRDWLRKDRAMKVINPRLTALKIGCLYWKLG